MLWVAGERKRACQCYPTIIWLVWRYLVSIYWALMRSIFTRGPAYLKPCYRPCVCPDKVTQMSLTVGATCLYPSPIASQADADQFTACSTVTGDITIATSVIGSIKLDGPKVITECLPASNCSGLTSLGGSTLETIGADFNLQGINNLTTIEFSMLEAVQNLI